MIWDDVVWADMGVVWDDNITIWDNMTGVGKNMTGYVDIDRASWIWAY